MPKTRPRVGKKRSQPVLLLLSAFLIASCGLVYELVAGTVSSYLLGDSVTQFSRTIGVYLFAMGVGSYLSRFILRETVEKFIEIEIILALCGGVSAPLLFWVFSVTPHYQWVLYCLLLVVGTLVGLEIPLLLRILKDHMNFRELVARVLSLDYIGGLVAAVAFPLFLLRPEVGLVRASLLAGLLNCVVAFIAIALFRTSIRFRLFLVKAAAVFFLLLAALMVSKPLENFLEEQLHADPVVYSEQTPYQKIVLTSWKKDFSLFLNNNLQFNSFDEYRYHEVLVHIPVQIFLERRKNRTAPFTALVMGGGDGLAVREFLRYQQLAALDLVEIDPAMTRLAQRHPWLRALNQGALFDPRVRIYHQDAFIFAKNPPQRYDVLVLDFPDPSNFAIGKLYSDTFFRRLRNLMSEHAVAAIQSTSPLIARQTFWCIHNTIAQQGYATLPYHTYVPSFGEWGFIAFAQGTLRMPQRLELEQKLRFLTASILPTLAHFPADMAYLPTRTQSLLAQNLVHYYESEWRRINP
ncbi:MAG: polyamine aminopropyltransferase [Turneriella sp.]|nr:polyamine aminopropyltransferase [Turneriella sp.]